MTNHFQDIYQKSAVNSYHKKTESISNDFSYNPNSVEKLKAEVNPIYYSKYTPEKTAEYYTRYRSIEAEILILNRSEELKQTIDAYKNKIKKIDEFGDYPFTPHEIKVLLKSGKETQSNEDELVKTEQYISNATQNISEAQKFADNTNATNYKKYQIKQLDILRYFSMLDNQLPNKEST